MENPGRLIHHRGTEDTEKNQENKRKIISKRVPVFLLYSVFLSGFVLLCGLCASVVNPLISSPLASGAA
jgi:hypothetical protein